MSINVKDCGARGDGATDDTEAIQRAIDAATQTGESVEFPAGEYLVSGPLTFPLSLPSIEPEPAQTPIRQEAEERD